MGIKQTLLIIISEKSFCLNASHSLLTLQPRGLHLNEYEQGGTQVKISQYLVIILFKAYLPRVWSIVLFYFSLITILTPQNLPGMDFFKSALKIQMYGVNQFSFIF